MCNFIAVWMSQQILQQKQRFSGKNIHLDDFYIFIRIDTIKGFPSNKVNKSIF